MKRRLHASRCTDENDIELIMMLQQYVLMNYPNPERKDCLDAETLQAFVYAPETLDLSDDRFLHIFKCAECTRELIRHQEERAQQERLLRKSSREILGEITDMPLRIAKASLLLLFSLAWTAWT